MDNSPGKTKLPAVASTGNPSGGATGAGGNILRSSSSGKNSHKKLAPLEGKSTQPSIHSHFTTWGIVCIISIISCCLLQA